MKMEINKKEVGKRIRDIRNSMDLSMEKFGKLIGDLPRSTVNNWERGINLPKQETLNRIAEVGYTTNEYLLYGDQENQYILDLLTKKARKIHPKLQKLILEEVKELNKVDDKSLNRALDFFVVNLIPPTEKDVFTFQLIDEEEHLYIGYTDHAKKPQIYLHHDKKENVLHILPFTFSSFPMDRLLVYLANEESLPYFAENIDKDMLEEFIIMYSVAAQENEPKLYPLTYDETANAYIIKEVNIEKMDGKLYLPFVDEIKKELVFIQQYIDKYLTGK